MSLVLNVVSIWLGVEVSVLGRLCNKGKIGRNFYVVCRFNGFVFNF